MKGSLTITLSTLDPLVSRVEDILTGYVFQAPASAMDFRQSFTEDFRLAIYQAFAQYMYHAHTHRFGVNDTDLVTYLVDEYLGGNCLPIDKRSDIVAYIGNCLRSAYNGLSGYLQRIVYDLCWNGETLHEITLMPSLVPSLLIIGVETQLDDVEETAGVYSAL